MKQMARYMRISVLTAVATIGIGGAILAAPRIAPHSHAKATQPVPSLSHIVAMRRLTESQYRNSIADIFGSDIRVAGRFEPVVRPVHELLASGARAASISPAGLEQYDAIARGIAAQVFDDNHRDQFVPCVPKASNASDSACARTVLAALGQDLFRRPLRADEQAYYVSLADQASTATGSFNKGLELALSAMLVSPYFLYIVETAEPVPGHAGAWRLDNYSRAARLSFTLWNSTPNAALLNAAAQHQLTDPNQLDAIAAHMVHSPRFTQGVRAFFADMLLYEKFDELAKDPIVYPYFNQDVAQALPEQMLQTITRHLLDHDGDYRDLFTTRETVLNRALGALYQLPVHQARGWEPYEWPKGSARAGLLGQAGFLAIYSHSGRSSPTLRGRAIRELILCQPVPNPPGNVNFTAVQDVHNKAMPTARDRLSAHATDPSCAGCHKIIDPIGLSLENYDGIGAFRATENDALIDASGTMDGKAFAGGVGLGEALAKNPDTTACVASRALEYMTGQASEDAALIDTLEQTFAAHGYHIRDLFLAVATMPQVWTVTPETPAAPATHVALLKR